MRKLYEGGKVIETEKKEFAQLNFKHSKDAISNKKLVRLELFVFRHPTNINMTKGTFNHDGHKIESHVVDLKIPVEAGDLKKALIALSEKL